MKHLPPSIQFFVQLAKTQARVAYRFDRALGGLSFTEFLILLSLEQSPAQELSRIELADQVGLTASGITRLLLPMAKIHLVKDGRGSSDARMRTVQATAAGKQKLADEIERLKFLTDELLPEGTKREAEGFTKHLQEIAARAGNR